MRRGALPSATWAATWAVGLVLLPLALMALLGAVGLEGSGGPEDSGRSSPMATWDESTAPSGAPPRVAGAARPEPWAPPTGAVAAVDTLPAPGTLLVLPRGDLPCVTAPLGAESSRLL